MKREIKPGVTVTGSLLEPRTKLVTPQSASETARTPSVTGVTSKRDIPAWAIEDALNGRR